MSSSFETGLDGWTSFQNGAFAPEWVPPAGPNSGYARLTDSTTGWGYFRAPAAFTAQAAQYGGALSFSLRHDVQGDPVSYSVRVGLTGGGLTLINEQTLPTSSWTSYTFGLELGLGWRVFSDLSRNYSAAAPLATQTQLEAVLSGLNGLYIAADYTPGYAPSDLDRTSIDDVSLTVVPAPGAAALLGLGGLLSALRRR
ncbi:hypothetical protein KBY92_12565 [Synechococcus sp. Cruz CV-v-12]|nr:hypothetical protein [Synechococcus sp. Cruz CV-v-12]